MEDEGFTLLQKTIGFPYFRGWLSAAYQNFLNSKSTIRCRARNDIERTKMGMP